MLIRLYRRTSTLLTELFYGVHFFEFSVDAPLSDCVARLDTYYLVEAQNAEIRFLGGTYNISPNTYGFDFYASGDYYSRRSLFQQQEFTIARCNGLLLASKVSGKTRIAGRINAKKQVKPAYYILLMLLGSGLIMTLINSYNMFTQALTSMTLVVSVIMGTAFFLIQLVTLWSRCRNVEALVYQVLTQR